MWNLMQEKTIALIKKFEKEQRVRVGTQDTDNLPMYWEVPIWMTKAADYQWMSGKPDISRVWGRKYLTTPTADGQVLVVRNPQKSNAFSIES